MIRNGAEYLDSTRDGREVHIGGERVKDIPSHPMFKPLVDVRAHIYDRQHGPKTRPITREPCGGQICLTPDKAAFETEATEPWLEKFHSVNEGWMGEDRCKPLAFARALLNSDHAGHRLTFQLFAQSPPFAHLAAVYRNLDWGGPGWNWCRRLRAFPKTCSAKEPALLATTPSASGSAPIRS